MSVRQKHSEISTTAQSTTSVIAIDDSIPLVTEGLEIFSQSFTPTAADSVIVVAVELQVDISQNGAQAVVAVFEDSVCIGAAFDQLGLGVNDRINVKCRAPAASTDARTYSVRVGTTAGTTYVNDDHTASTGHNGNEGSLFEITEYAPPAASLWTPSEITTALWLDASDLDTIPESGDLVSQWDDKSANAEHVKATGSLRPSTAELKIGGRNAIYFDGSNRMEQDTNPLTSPFTELAVFAVIRSQSVTTSGALFSMTGSGGNPYYAHCPWGDGNIYFDVDGNSGSNRVTYASGFTVGAANLVSFITETSLQEIRVNGSVGASDATGHSVAVGSGIQIGSNTSYSQNCAIGEFIVVEGTVSTATREQIEGYLAHRWQLASLLPSGHTYKDSPPTV